MSAVVTQADRNAAADLLESGGSKGILCRFDHAMTMRYTDHLDGDSFVQAFARHRSEAVEELVEVLERACGLVAWIAERASKIDYARYLESEGQEGKIEPEINALVDAMSDGFLASYRDDFEAVLSKHRGEQG